MKQSLFAFSLRKTLFLALFARELLMLFATPEFMAGAALVGVLAPSLLLSQMYIFAPGIAQIGEFSFILAGLGATYLSGRAVVAYLRTRS